MHGLEDWSHGATFTVAGDEEVPGASVPGKCLGVADARRAAELGLQFLRLQSTCSVGLPESPEVLASHPKTPPIHKLFLGQLNSSQRGPSLNLLCTSVQQDEDYIGRGSRLSRC